MSSELEQRYTREGVWPDGYVPLFQYLQGLGAPRRDGPFSLALVSDDQFIVCACDESLCRQPRATRFWSGIHHELGRIAKRDIAAIHIFAPDSPEFHAEVLVTRVALKYANRAMNRVLPGSIRPAFHKWILAIRCVNASGTNDVYFACPPVRSPMTIRSGMDPSSLTQEFLVDLLPADIGKAVKTARSWNSLLSPVAPDPAALAAANSIAMRLAELARLG